MGSPNLAARMFPVISAGLLALCAMPASAAMVVSPNNLAATEGATANSYPFNPAPFGTPSLRSQQVYSASDFASIGPGGGWITQLLFRPDAVAGAAFSGTLPDIQIDLSTTSAAPDGLSATFANNVGANNLTVLARGPLTLSSTFSGPAGGPKAFDIVIDLTTPFLYLPSSGNLLVDVRNFGGGTTTPFDAVNVSGDSVSRIAALLGSSTGTVETIGLVTAFTIVPEPAGSALLATAATALLGLGRHRRVHRDWNSSVR